MPEDLGGFAFWSGLLADGCVVRTGGQLSPAAPRLRPGRQRGLFHCWLRCAFGIGGVKATRFAPDLDSAFSCE